MSKWTGRAENVLTDHRHFIYHGCVQIKDWCSSHDATVRMSGLDGLFQFMDRDKAKYQKVVEYMQTQIEQYEPCLK